MFMIEIKYKTVLYDGIEYKLPYKTFMDITIEKYRVVTDTYLGYEAQQWKWYFPFWVQVYYCNTGSTIEYSLKLIDDCIGSKIILE